MRKLVLLFVIFVLSFSSCRKDENLVSIDVDAIRTQMMTAVDLTVSQVQDMLNQKSSQPKLKDGTLPSGQEQQPTMVRVYVLDQRTFEVTGTTATKNFLYIETDESGNRTNLLTIQQMFQLKNGSVDLNNYTIRYQVGCVYRHEIFIDVPGSFNQITYFLHLENGDQFFYYGNNGNMIQIYPIAGCKWEFDAYHWDGDFWRNYKTTLIDYYSQSNVVSLILDVKKENVKSTVSMDRSFIQNAEDVVLIGEDAQGITRRIGYKVSYTSSLPSRISFSAYFDIKEMIISNQYGSSFYYTNQAKITAHSLDGKIIYSF